MTRLGKFGIGSPKVISPNPWLIKLEYDKAGVERDKRIKAIKTPTGFIRNGIVLHNDKLSIWFVSKAKRKVVKANKKTGTFAFGGKPVAEKWVVI